MIQLDYLLSVAHKFEHFGNKSGYDLLQRYIAPRLSCSFEKYVLFTPRERGLLNLLYRVNVRVANRILRSDLDFNLNRKREISVLHFLYPENTISYYKNFKKKELSILGTFHQPRIWFDKIKIKDPIRLRNLRQCDVAIALGSNQLEPIQEYLRIKDIELIPHGVDTDFFSPRPLAFNNTEEVSILVPGMWMRDLHLMNKVIGVYNQRRPRWRFHLLMSKTVPDIKKDFRNIFFYENVSDLDLLSLYHSCTIAVIPLKDSVANNAVLESMSTGTPLICSDVGAVRQYVGDAGVLVSNTLEHFICEIDKLIGDARERQRLSVESRSRAMQYDWRVVADQVAELYRSLR